MLNITNIEADESESKEIIQCNWRKIGSHFPGQSAYETDCGATTTAVIGAEYRYKYCPFCRNSIKFV